MFILLLVGIVVFALAYRFYGRFLDRQYNINPERETPATKQYDGTDYVPARTPVLMGHHFSSIAGAGPIVGPIIAVSFFGWLPGVKKTRRSVPVRDNPDRVKDIIKE